MSTPVPFRKMNGLGNEIVVVDLRGRVGAFTPAAARTIGRRGSPRFDQMMVLHNPETAGTDAYVRIYNADGSEAGACGNGMRCVSWVVAEETGRRALTFETRAGILAARVTDAGHISVDMGAPRFGWRDIPLSRPFEDTRAIDLSAEQNQAYFADGLTEELTGLLGKNLQLRVVGRTSRRGILPSCARTCSKWCWCATVTVLIKVWPWTVRS